MDEEYLPPEPAGPEPELGALPAPAPPPPAPPPQAYPTPQQQLGWNAPPQPQSPQPGWQPPPQQAWQQPPPQQGWQQPQAWAWQPPPQVPDNGPAVAGFVLSVVAAALLLLSAGLSSVVSVVCAGLGIFYSLRGRRRVDRGETPKHRGLAQAGFITGIVTVVLAVLATTAWILVIVFSDSLDQNQNNVDGIQTTIRLAALGGRLGAALLR